MDTPSPIVAEGLFLFRSLSSSSIIKLNIIGLNGSPCLTPLLMLIVPVDSDPSFIRVDAEARLSVK